MSVAFLPDLRGVDLRLTARDVDADEARVWLDRVEEALAAGVDAGKIVVDPGLGFAKTPEHNWRLTRRMGEGLALGDPVLVGASRKRYLGNPLAGPDGVPRPVDGREAATVATSLLAVAAGGRGG